MTWNHIHAVLADPATQSILSLISLVGAVAIFFAKLLWKKKGWLGRFISKHDSISLFLLEEVVTLGYSLYAAIIAPISNVNSLHIEPDRFTLFIQTYILLNIYIIITLILYALFKLCVKAYRAYAQHQAEIKYRIIGTNNSRRRPKVIYRNPSPPMRTESPLRARPHCSRFDIDPNVSKNTRRTSTFHEVKSPSPIPPRAMRMLMDEEPIDEDFEYLYRKEKEEKTEGK